jgi:hypothetical protein
MRQNLWVGSGYVWLGANYGQVRSKHIGNTGECSDEAAVKTVGWGGICMEGSKLWTGKKEADSKHRRVFW